MHFPKDGQTQATNGFIGSVIGVFFDTEKADEVKPEEAEIVDKFIAA